MDLSSGTTHGDLGATGARSTSSGRRLSVHKLGTKVSQPRSAEGSSWAWGEGGIIEGLCETAVDTYNT